MAFITRTSASPAAEPVRSTDVTSEQPVTVRQRRNIGAGALFGVLAAAVAVGVGDLVAVATGQSGAPELAVGSALINLAPVSAKDFAIRTFGTNDKLVLVTAVLAVLAVVAAIAGILALRRAWLGIGIVVAFGVIGMIAAGTAPAATFTSVLPSLAAAIAGALALFLLLRGRRRSATAQDGRRAVLKTGVAVAAVAVATVITGRVVLSSSDSVAASRARIRLPRPTSPAQALPAGYQYSIDGLTPFITSPTDFYRVDTALALPQVPAERWTLSIHGMADHPLRLSFDDILRMPLVERYITLSCVSNEVGGPYVGTVRWLGVPLANLLRQAGIQRGATQLVSTSVDGMTIGTPTEIVTDGREALLAVAMNGQPLPIEHGFPARLIVPGLFGYASATKWVTDLNLTTMATQPYWVRRGYVPVGTVRTGSRIDLPRPFAQLSPGPVTVAGIAFAQHSGISAVQVGVDSGPWQDAELTTSVGIDTWRQWRYRWQATPGTHQLRVRAANGRGELQPETRTPVFPSGATGWESVVVTVTT